MLKIRNKALRKILLQKSVSIFSVALLVLATLFIHFVILKGIAKSDPVPFSDKATAIEKPSTNIGLPVRLIISSINLDATIYDVGLTSDGAMDIKEDPTQVGWYRLGPRPGETGSAVIAGHYGWTDKTGSVFNNLHTLKKGDEVSVTDDKGKSTIFVVRESKKFDPDTEETSSIFKSSDNKAHLNLITCGGTWQESKQTYSNRLVVFTDKK